ncbi:MAG: hypothetical protein KF905_14690 [Flavobacteriales bacterium]|nr:hypothetical protein [Flavobacteriales bacterium]
MKQLFAPLIALVFAAALLAPSGVLLQFKLDQARIAKELCVQRELMEDMRTCHGECQLSKRFKALEQDAEAGFPAERIQIRYEPVVDLEKSPLVLPEPLIQVMKPAPLFPISDGFGASVEHVPRA